ncbi:MAG: thermonuclease family protein [Hyphomicrobiaceae bacterium]
MLRWKKRDEGFEWQQYVRTTIKLRREARREKAQKLGEQVAVGAKAAGAAADALAKSGARRLGDAARSGLSRLGIGAATAMRLAGLGLGSLAGLAGKAAAPALDLLGRPGVSGPLCFAGLIATVAGCARAFVGGGLDFEAWVALCLGASCIALGLGPALWLGHGAIPKLTAARITGLPSRPWLVGVGAALALVMGGVVVSVVPVAGLGFTMPKFAGFISLPDLPFSRSETISGKARVLSTNIVRIGNRKVRLEGIEVPDLNQRCLKAGARHGGRTWACGQDAREAAQGLINGRQLSCRVASGGEVEVVLGRCTAKGTDVAEALVKSGYAFDQSGLMSSYGAAESAAKAAKAGIWSSAEPERPAQWRDRIWAAAKREAPDGCPIKGRVRGEERVYLLPWESNYARVRIRKRRGERWFCSQDEAEAAGWRSAHNG